MRGNVSGVVRCQCRIERAILSKLDAIPERFRHCTFGNFEPRSDRQQLALTEIAYEPLGSFCLTGEYGKGKTHLAIAQYRYHVQLERPCLFLSMAGLLSELRRAELEADYFCLVLDRIRYAEKFHLFIDDIDKFKVTDFKFEVLFDAFDTIYRRKLGLTVTSNYSLRELIEFEKLHPAIVRRIDDSCKAVQL